MDYVLSLSYGKDSLACLGAIEELGWPLDRIVHAEVWATDTIPADLPPMVEFKAKADRIIKERWGLEVQHIRTKQTAESVFYHKRTRGNRIEEIVGWPMTKGPKVGCELQKALKVRPMQTAQKGAITYLGIRTFEKLQWDVGASYATHDRHMMPDLLEFLGPDLETISLPVKFSVFLGTNPIQEVERLRAMIRSGTVERLVLGGHVYGDYKWAITKMSAELKTFDNRGNCWAANTTLSLKEYARR